MSNWQRTQSRANDRRATKKLVTTERKTAKAKGESAKSPRTLFTATSSGSIVTRTANLKAKAERSKERQAERRQMMVAVGGLELPSLPPRPAFETVAQALARMSEGADLDISKRTPRRADGKQMIILGGSNV